MTKLRTSRIISLIFIISIFMLFSSSSIFAENDDSAISAADNPDESTSPSIGIHLSGKAKKEGLQSEKKPQVSNDSGAEKIPRIKVVLNNQFSLPINILADKQFMLAPGETRTLSLPPDIIIEFSVVEMSGNSGLPTIPAEPNVRRLTPLGSEGESQRIIDFRPRSDSPAELYIDEKKVKTGKQPDLQEK